MTERVCVSCSRVVCRPLKGSYDLDLKPMTLTCEFDIDILKIRCYQNDIYLFICHRSTHNNDNTHVTVQNRQDSIQTALIIALLIHVIAKIKIFKSYSITDTQIHRQTHTER